MNPATKRFLSVVLSAAIAFQGFPTSALAEAIDAASLEEVAQIEEITSVEDDLEQVVELGSDAAEMTEAEEVPLLDSEDVRDEALAEPSAAADAEEEADSEAEPDSETGLTSQAEYVGTCGDCDWEIDADGVLTIHEGTLASNEGDVLDFWPWHAYRSMVTSVVLDGDVKGSGSLAYALFGMQDLESVDLSGLDTSSVTSMEGMFDNCAKLSSLDLSGFGTSSVTDMTYLFDCCASLESVDLSGWNTSSVTDMEAMFGGCAKLSALDLSGFDTSGVTNMSFLFVDCTALETLDLSSWDTSSVTTMRGMLLNCPSLSSITVGPSWSTAAVTDGKLMFEGCTSLVGGKGTAYDSAHTDAEYARADNPNADDPDADAPGYLTRATSGTCGTCPWEFADGVLTIHKGKLASNDRGSYNFWPWYGLPVTSIVLDGDVKGSNSMKYAFYRFDGLASADLSGLDTSSVTVMDSMFSDCSSLSTLNLSDWKTSSLTSTEWMFYKCSSLTELDLSSWDVSSDTDMGSMFTGCSSLASLDLSDWKTPSLVEAWGVFSGCSSLTALDLSGWNTSKVTNMSSMFSGCSSLASLNVSDWDTSKVKNFGATFSGCSSLASMDLSSWDTCTAKSMYWMFNSCSELVTIVVGAGWSTGELTDSEDMFDGCTSLVGGNGTAYDPDHTDAGYACVDDPDAYAPGYLTLAPRGVCGTCAWELVDGVLTIHEGTLASNDEAKDDFWPWYPLRSQVTSIVLDGEVKATGSMAYAFYEMENLLSADFSTLDTSSVTYMGILFQNCSSLESVDLSGWDTSKVTSMFFMFDSCSSLESFDLSGWDTSSVTYMGGMFRCCSSLSSITVGAGWSIWGVADSEDMFDGCTALVGGNGTAYDSAHTDAEYARVDDLDADAPGYLTLAPRGTCGKCAWDIDERGVLTIHEGTLASNNKLTANFWPWYPLRSQVTSIVLDGDVKGSSSLMSVFSGMKNLTSADLPGLVTSDVTDISGLFNGCSLLVSIDDSDWDTSSVTDMTAVFRDCSSLTELDLSGWDTHAATDMGCMFYGCSSLVSLDDAGWDTSSVEYMDGMFHDCASLEELDLSGWDTSAVEVMAAMFFGCYSLSSILVGDTWSTAAVTDGTNMFFNCTELAGGNGTAHDESHVDAEYARVDAEGAPGYFTAAPKDIAGATVAVIADQTYMGSEIEPQVSVTMGDAELVLGTDYTVSYANNVNVGTATVTITGKDDYRGTKEVTFKIVAKAISGATVAAIANQTYTGSAIKPAPSVKDGSKTLKSGTDYTLSYASNVSVGTATVTVTGKGNYTGTKKVTFKIVAKPISGATVAAIADKAYTGSAIKPAPTVKDGSKTLKSGTDYTLAYANNTNVGTATVTITGKGNYTGTKKATFKIVAKAISGATVATIANQTYTGSAIKPAPTVKDGSKTLKSGTDYTLAYANNVNAGTATLTITGKGNYKGTKKVSFKVVAASIAKATVAKVADQTYTGKAIKPSPKVTFGGKALVKGTDYALSYKNNTAAGTATITVTGRGNFSGAKSVTFKIVVAMKEFPDVPKAHWAHDEIGRAAALGILSGYKDGTFGPSDHITRGQIAVMFWSAAGKPKAGSEAKSFSDVTNTGAYYYEAVRWASSAGVVSGYANNTFGPGDDITREQLCVMAANYATKVGKRRAAGSASDYAKVPDASKVSSYARPAVGWAYREGVLPILNGKLDPQAKADRAQAAYVVVGTYDFVR